jgi:hypothetical protein
MLGSPVLFPQTQLENVSLNLKVVGGKNPTPFSSNSNFYHWFLIFYKAIFFFCRLYTNTYIVCANVGVPRFSLSSVRESEWVSECLCQ